jgi:uncharacterized protein YjbI with pentapeptide repeats
MVTVRTSTRLWLGAAACALPGLLGAWLIFDPRFAGDDPNALGMALVSGSIVAAAVFLAESRRDLWISRLANAQAVLNQIIFSHDLTGVDLRNRDLSGLSLRGKTLRDANLEGANLRGADLSGADLRGAHLARADLRGARLVRADLRLADATSVNLEGATLWHMKAGGCVLVGANLHGARGQGADLSALTPADLKKVVESGVWGSWRAWVRPWEIGDYSQGRETLMNNVRATSSAWCGADFTGASLEKADFRYSRLGDAYNDPLEGLGLFRRVFLGITRHPQFGSPPHIFGEGIPGGPATFTDAVLDGAEFEGCTGPDLLLTRWQISQCRSNVRSEELAEGRTNAPPTTPDQPEAHTRAL